MKLKKSRRGLPNSPEYIPINILHWRRQELWQANKLFSPIGGVWERIVDS